MTLGLDPAWYLRQQAPGNCLSRVVKTFIDERNQPFSGVRFEKIQVMLDLIVGSRLVREEVAYYARVLHDGAITRFNGSEGAVEFRCAVTLFFRQRRTDRLGDGVDQSNSCLDFHVASPQRFVQPVDE